MHSVTGHLENGFGDLIDMVPRSRMNFSSNGSGRDVELDVISVAVEVQNMMMM